VRIQTRPHGHRTSHRPRGLIILLLFALPSLPQAAEPGRWLVQETAAVAAPGRLTIDLIDPDSPLLRPSPGLIRIGVRRGEWQLGREEAGFKYATGPRHAVYGRLGLDTGSGRSRAAMGLSLDLGDSALALNGNIELRKEDTSAHLYLNGAARLPLRLPSGHPGRAAAIAETSLSDKAGEELAVAAGLRWTPHPAVTMDLILLGLRGADQSLGTPVALRLTLGL